MLRDDHPEQWTRAELERELVDVLPEEIESAVEDLAAEGVLTIADDEAIRASLCAQTLDALELIDAGALERVKRHGVLRLVLTEKGRTQVARARRTVALPESPQHRFWKQTRKVAVERIDGLREDARRAVQDAGRLLDREEANSEALLLLAVRLREAVQYLGSATYCAREWPEPDEGLAEVANVHRNEIGMIERGQCEPGLLVLLILADLFEDHSFWELLKSLPVPRERRPARHSKGGHQATRRISTTLPLARVVGVKPSEPKARRDG